jgi:hypothetical protein
MPNGGKETTASPSEDALQIEGNEESEIVGKVVDSLLVARFSVMAVAGSYSWRNIAGRRLDTGLKIWGGEMADKKRFLSNTSVDQTPVDRDRKCSGSGEEDGKAKSTKNKIS